MTYKVTVTEDVTSVSVSGNTTSINLTGEQTEISVVNPASSVTFNPSQSFTSTNVQDALFESHKMIGEQSNNYSVTLDYGNKFEIQDSFGFARLDADATASGWFANFESSDKMTFTTDGNLNALLDSSGSTFYDNLLVQGNPSQDVGLIQTNNTSGLQQHHLVMKNSGASVGFLGSDSDSALLGIGSASVAFTSAGFLGGDFSPATQYGGTKNGVIDLGKTNSRFRDLYLSSGIYFGTDTSNKFDYEEGTWTPTLTLGASLALSSNASYIKIGNLVNVTAELVLINTNNATTGSLVLGGLPFQPNAKYPCIVTDSTFFTGFSGIVSGITNNADSTIAFRQSRNTFVVNQNDILSTSTGKMIFQCSYKTDS